jgi:hypothetical protein
MWPGKGANVVGVDNDDDDDDDRCMNRMSPFVALLAASGAFAHEGHGATPAHAHAGGLAFDVGAAVAALIVVAALAVVARRRAR